MGLSGYNVLYRPGPLFLLLLATTIILLLQIVLESSRTCRKCTVKKGEQQVLPSGAPQTRDAKPWEVHIARDHNEQSIIE